MKQTAGQAKQTDKRNWLIILLLLVTAAAIGTTVWALFFREQSVPISPDYPPRSEEEYAEPIPGDDAGKLSAPEGGGAVSLSYSNEVAIDLASETASLLFANPGKSSQDMVVQVVIQELVIIQSGRLTPGNQVTTLALLPGAADKLSAGGYDGKFVVSYYDPLSGEKAMVNTEIPISVIVS